jgi:hypothetical protein
VVVDLGGVLPGQVLRRPSAAVKTPYVADVMLLSDDEAAAASSSSGTGQLQVLAHTPALDGAGTIVPGARVWMTAHAARREGQQGTKTSHVVQVGGADVTAWLGGGCLIGVRASFKGSTGGAVVVAMAAVSGRPVGDALCSTC